MIKEIIFFSMGDSNKISTWSNVPFLFCKELEQKGILVRRIDIGPDPIIRRRYNSIIYRLCLKIWRDNIYQYERSWFFYIITNYKIKKAVKKYRSADLCIFCTFSFYNKFNKIPSLLLCDWTFDILIRGRLNRTPYYIERFSIKREDHVINHADYVVSLFPECADIMKKSNPKANIYYLGNYFVNSVFNEQIDAEETIVEKQKNKALLFIGSQNNITYLKTAQKIAEAYCIAKNRIDNLSLHMIGIESSALKCEDKGIFCYGYLHKDCKDECVLYYKTLIQSSLIINVTPLWAGYSSIIESMYYYTPVLVSPFKDFVREFGTEIDFGKYNSTFNEKDIADDICNILSSERYAQMAKNAHIHTRKFTWENYVNQIISLIST